MRVSVQRRQFDSNHRASRDWLLDQEARAAARHILNPGRQGFRALPFTVDGRFVERRIPFPRSPLVGLGLTSARQTLKQRPGSLEHGAPPTEERAISV